MLVNLSSDEEVLKLLVDDDKFLEDLLAKLTVGNLDYNLTPELTDAAHRTTRSPLLMRSQCYWRISSSPTN